MPAPISNSPETRQKGDSVELSAETPNALTVDVEDYFHVSAFDQRVCRSNWDRYESRVENNTDKLLAIFDQCGVRGTFFVLGWVAERYPKLVRRIAREGHELASHGYWHQLVYDLTPEEFAKDIQNSKEAIADACDIVVTAYRAPSFSITEKSLWAFDVLAEHDFRIDSSVFPISGHDRYGVANANKAIHDIETTAGTIREFPLSAWTRGRISVPIGGGYFRLFPLPLTCRAIDAVRGAGRPVMFYTHPWEFDPDQPRIGGIGLKNRSRHYVGLRHTGRRLTRMLEQYRFGTMSEVLTSIQPARDEAIVASSSDDRAVSSPPGRDQARWPASMSAHTEQ
jgi:polysaccharide deacetylase family protein (PEP-CTERM system associated)